MPGSLASWYKCEPIKWVLNTKTRKKTPLLECFYSDDVFWWSLTEAKFTLNWHFVTDFSKCLWLLLFVGFLTWHLLFSEKQILIGSLKTF